MTRMQMYLLREGILDENGINKIEKEVEEQSCRLRSTARWKRVHRNRSRS